METPTPSTRTTLTTAPHRLMFFGGTIQFLLALLLWGVELGGRHGLPWSPLPFALPPSVAHGALMLYGLFPFFIFGFLMTTFPRWMRGEEIGKRRYVPAFLLLALGNGLLYAGMFIGAAVAAAGVAGMLLGWGLGWLALLEVFRNVETDDKGYERWLLTALALGWLGLALFLGGLLGGSWWLYDLSLDAGLWLYLLPVLIVVSHRMLPFFSVCALPDYQEHRPRWTLPLMALCVTGHLAAEQSGLPQWSFLFDLPLGLAALYHSWLWGLRRAQAVGLLGVLHIAFLWLGIGLTLYGLNALGWLLGYGDTLGRGPLHALAIGFVGSMVVAMITRVSRGHSGRELRMDRLAWSAFIALQAAAVLRVAGELPGLADLNLIAALAWLLFAGPWALRYALIYLRPRIDGKPD